MSDFKAPVYRVVAMPKLFLWAPFEMAIINIIASLAFMILCIGVLGLTPFWSLIPLATGHVVLIGMGTRDPHLTTILQATGRYKSARPNLAKIAKGVKYVP